MRILVIDDEQMIRALAEKILTRAGYDVLVAESGDKGLELFRQQPDRIDMVVVDYVMEGLSGEETLRALRQANADLPCLMSSGHTNDITELPSDLQHKVEFLQKPYRANDLVEQIDSMCQAHCQQS